jgi:hypothetical protein
MNCNWINWRRGLIYRRSVANPFTPLKLLDKQGCIVDALRRLNLTQQLWVQTRKESPKLFPDSTPLSLAPPLCGMSANPPTWWVMMHPHDNNGIKVHFLLDPLTSSHLHRTKLFRAAEGAAYVQVNCLDTTKDVKRQPYRSYPHIAHK